MSTLVQRIADLAAAVRDKINVMMPRLLPAGGANGQVLTKTSATDYAVAWSTPSGGGGGGNVVVSQTDPVLTSPGVWVELNPDGSVKTFWIENGQAGIG